MRNNVLTARTSYKYYKTNSENPMSLNQYLDILYGFFEFIKDKVLKGSEIKFPQRLGKLSIIGRKHKINFDKEGNITNLAPNWKSTNKLWETCEECKNKKQLVYHLNEHTDRVTYKFFWSKEKVLVPYKTMYYFKACRDLARTLAKLIKEKQQEYIVL